jgi:hypothetical protein
LGTGCFILTKNQIFEKIVVAIGKASFMQGIKKNRRFFFVDAIAAFLAGFKRGFKYVRDGVFEGFNFARIYVARRQKDEM